MRYISSGANRQIKIFPGSKSMNLYIIRHAIAVEAGTPEYENDSQRPLTDKGKKKMQKIAEGLMGLETEINLILSSPYLRAVQTAKILRRVFDLSKQDIVETEHLTPVGYGDALKIGRASCRERV